jgi:hypothetical protein
LDGDRPELSQQRLTAFTKGQSPDQLIQLEKEELTHNSRDARPGSVKDFQYEYKQDKASRVSLLETTSSRKRTFRATMSQQQHKTSHHLAMHQILAWRELLPTQDLQHVGAPAFYGFW